MSRNKIKQFQTMMSAQGMELTPDQAAAAYREGAKLIKKAKKMSQVQLWDLLEQEGVSQEEAQVIQHAREPD